MNNLALLSDTRLDRSAMLCFVFVFDKKKYFDKNKRDASLMVFF